MKKYKIIRGFFCGDREVIATGLTLKEAQKHCRDKETSSRTCSEETLQEVGTKRGAWFDGYTEE